MAFAKCLANLRSLTLLKSLINNEEHFQIILDNCLANDDEILAKLARVVEKKENDFFNTKKIKYIEQIPNHNAIKKVLDFGGANGAIASAMAERYGFDVVVCDTNIHEQKFSRVKFIKTAAGEKLPFKDGEFDLISCFMVLHHIQDVDQIIEELYRCSSKWLLIQEHNNNEHVEPVIDVLHLMYSFVYKTEDYETLKKAADYKAWYMTKNQLEFKMANKFKKIIEVDTNPVTNNYFAIYEKIM